MLFFKKNIVQRPLPKQIDVGITLVEDSSKPRGYRIAGDVHFESVSKKASFITLVLGGVGPMTIAMLLKNTLLACERNFT